MKYHIILGNNYSILLSNLVNCYYNTMLYLKIELCMHCKPMVILIKVQIYSMIMKERELSRTMVNY